MNPGKNLLTMSATKGFPTKLSNTKLQKSFALLKTKMDNLCELLRITTMSRENKMAFSKIEKELQQRLEHLLQDTLEHEDEERRSHEELEMLRNDLYSVFAHKNENQHHEKNPQVEKNSSNITF